MGLNLANNVRVTINGVRVIVDVDTFDVNVTAFVSLAFAVLVAVIERVIVRVGVYTLLELDCAVIVFDIAKRVLLGFIVGVRVCNGTTVKVFVIVGLIV